MSILWNGDVTPWFVIAAVIVGVLADMRFGEPKRFHPLIGFGRYAQALEKTLNPLSLKRQTAQALDASSVTPRGWASLGQRLRGVAAWSLAVVPAVLLSWWVIGMLPLWAQWFVHVGLLWFALGGKSLAQHIGPIGDALARDDLKSARALASRVVSRDLSDAKANDVARAAVESALENGNDAVFGALFWFFIGGGPAALAFRLINTLDAMWGYRTAPLRLFGCAAARIDDAANWFPARLTALCYVLLGERRQAWQCWRSQAPLWDSPNAGPVMAAGAGALGVLLGGPARYHGRMEDRPALGCGAAPNGEDIHRALQLVRQTTWCYLGVGAVLVWGVFVLCGR